MTGVSCLMNWATALSAVVVGTPDHTHAIISLNAMKIGKHVYSKALTPILSGSRGK